MAMLIASFLLLATSAPVSTSAGTLGDLPPAKQDDGAMICKRYNELGSRLTAKRVCKTKKEWEEARTQNAEVVRQQRGAIGGPQPGNGG